MLMQVPTGQAPGRGPNTQALPTDEDQALFKEIGLNESGRRKSFVLKSAQHPGVFTLTADESKTGVSTNVQGSISGSWLKDTVQRLTEVLEHTEAAEKELLSSLSEAKDTKQRT